jgi:diphthine synthase
MLTFIGLGLYDEKDITVKGMEAIRESDVVYAEFYTSRLAGTTIEKMEKAYGRRVNLLDREDIEVDAERSILCKAKNLNVVLLTGGDPMIATTHVDLRLRATDMGISTRIIHAPSIFSAAVGLSGLQNYKFGKSASVPFPYKDRISETPYDTIKLNIEHGLHTFLYLETSMDINRAIELLLSVEEKRKECLLEDRIAVGIAGVGSLSPIVKADRMERLKEYDFGATPHTIIVTGELHFMEREALNKFAGARPKDEEISSRH